MDRLFRRADILIPSEGTDMTRWSVIACDQHTSEKEYWEKLDSYVGDSPSTLRLMLPEAYLERDANSEAEKINRTMRDYLDSNLFRTLSESYIYLERALPSGTIRRGLVGMIDLDGYDYSTGSRSPIRATEGTVEERLPPRVEIRKGALMEMPHVMVFMNDPQDLVFQTCRSSKGSVPVYDFELNSDGGHITGWQMCGDSADTIDEAFDAITGNRNPGDVILAIGDGNHSLATAKKCGDRYALVELVNIHDPAIVFEPIHRVVFGTDTADFTKKYDGSILRLKQCNESYAQLVRDAEEICQDYISGHGGKIDYIHNDETALEMGSREGCFAVLLPTLDKNELFASVAANGPYPKKSFSIGHADEKRFYLECRKR